MGSFFHPARRNFFYWGVGSLSNWTPELWLTPPERKSKYLERDAFTNIGTCLCQLTLIFKEVIKRLMFALYTGRRWAFQGKLRQPPCTARICSAHPSSK